MRHAAAGHPAGGAPPHRARAPPCSGQHVPPVLHRRLHRRRRSGGEKLREARVSTCRLRQRQVQLAHLAGRRRQHSGR
eukprot:2280355-Pleurochrysis_carterae.AAC.1